MKLITRVSAFLIFFLSISIGTYAQTSADIEVAKSIARSNGYTDDEIDAMLNRRQTGETTNNASVTTKVLRGYDENPFPNKILADTLKQSNIYGHSIFKIPNLNFVPSYNIPTPINYRLAPGDEIIIDIWGDTYQNYAQLISPDGSITIQDIGPIYLSGQTIADAEDILKSSFSRIFSGISASQQTTFLRLSLGRIRSVTVNVVGDVDRPGTYTLPSLSNITSALYLSGGPTDIGSVRDIRIYRNNKLVKVLDVYDFIIDGDFSSNIRLEDNDLIKISTYVNLVKIDGKVKRPMTYELIDDETISSLLRYSGGFTSDAKVDKVFITRIKGSRKESYDVSDKDFSSFVLFDGDSVYVSPNIDENLNEVSIVGSVWHQGSYAISDTLKTLSQLITVAGGLKEDAYLHRAYIERFDEKRDSIIVNFNVKDVIEGNEDMVLLKDDKIRIFAYQELEERTMVYSYGELNRPDTFVFRRGMTLGDIILLSQGFSVGAAKSNITVARRNLSNGPSFARDSVATSFYFNLLDHPEDEDFELAPYDAVFVRKSPSYRKQQLISVMGEVIFPGQYVVEKSVLRVSDIINKAGGLNDDAYVAGATIQRMLTDEEYERMEVALGVAKKKIDSDSAQIEQLNRYSRYSLSFDLKMAINNPGSHHDVILRENDVIQVPKMNNTVRISGGVLYNNVVSYAPHYTVNDYIALAGGYARNAMKKKVYIVNMNGTAVAKGSKLFKPTPGCEIVVPVKNMDNVRRISAAEILSIASSTASISAMVISIVNAL